MPTYNQREKPRHTAIKVVLLLAGGLIVVGTGYYVYQARHNASQTLQAANAINAGSTAKFKRPKLASSLNAQSNDPTLKWATYHSPKGVFGVKYPTSWVAATAKQCNQTLLNFGLYLGSDAQTLQTCGASTPPQITILSAKNGQNAYDFANGFSGTQKTTAYADGVQGQRTLATASAAPTASESQQTPPPASGTPANATPNLPAGSLVMEYDFALHGRYYVARYVQLPTDTPAENVQSNFDTMVTQTLRFE